MNPRAVAIVVLLHGAALTALIMAKSDVIERLKPTTTIIDWVTPPPVPPEKPKPQPPHPTQQNTNPTVVKPIVGTVIDRTVDFPPSPPPPPTDFTGKSDTLPPTPPPPPPPPRFEPARAHANLSSYVSDADYPDAALRGEEQGTTRFRLVVGTDGRVTGCTIIGSSGSSALDAATCRLMKGRARFTPARDSAGSPTTDSVASAIRWVLPDG
jgi:protein TonB